MNIFFDKKKHIFVHFDKSTSPLFWGAQDELLPLTSESNEDYLLKIKVKKNEKRVGPLIGILTSKTKSGDIVGQKEMFINIQKELQINGGLSFVYTLEDCHEKHINGTFYSIEEKRWIITRFPYPNIIYNRISSRSEEKNNKFIKHKQKMDIDNIFMFNPCFIDKYSMHLLFSKNPLLKPLLPPTKLIIEDQDLEEFLTEYSKVYLKPTLRSQGNGIYYLKRDEAHSYVCQIGQHKNEFLAFNDLWSSIKNTITTTSYIAQKDIDSAKINGKKFDYRILSQYDRNEYQTTGIGIRVADLNRITTHLSKGGQIIPYESFRQPSLEKVFQWIMQECGKTLSTEYGFYAEFTMDLGRDQSGKLWIYEINAKPMTFDEIEIESMRMKKLINIFYHQSIFKN
ncbi:YheC/YheD family protein [Heyndrickxia sporothermodurans]